MDESHRYRASAGVRAINELKPILGLELTATPFVETDEEPVPFKNVIYRLPAGAGDGRRLREGAGRRHAEGLQPGGHVERRDRAAQAGRRRPAAREVKGRAGDLRPGDGRPIVKPFVLVIARDTTHASQLMPANRVRRVLRGRYKEQGDPGRFEQDGRGRRGDGRAAAQRVEQADEPTEIVIHVNMLKEGWDVTNLYTIVPLRAANARTLVEQSIGRGLRLPYGKRTGVDAVDRLNIVAHDKFQEIVDDSRKADSPIQLKTLVLADEEFERKIVTVISQSALAMKLGLHTPQPTATTFVPSPASQPVFTKPEEQKVAQIAYEVIKKLENQPQRVSSVSQLARPDIQAEITREVEERYIPAQLGLEGVVEAPDIAAIVAKTIEVTEQQTIDIPRILVVPRGEVKSGFKEFQLDLSNVNYQPISNELWQQELRTQKTRVLTLGEGAIDELRLEDYVVSGLVDFDDVSYDDHSELLYDLAKQTVPALSKLSERRRHAPILRVFSVRSRASLIARCRTITGKMLSAMT